MKTESGWSPPSSNSHLLKASVQTARSTTMRRVHWRGSSVQPREEVAELVPEARGWRAQGLARGLAPSAPTRSASRRTRGCERGGRRLVRLREPLEVGHEPELVERGTDGLGVVAVDLRRQQEADDRERVGEGPRALAVCAAAGATPRLPRAARQGSPRAAGLERVVDVAELRPPRTSRRRRSPRPPRARRSGRTRGAAGAAVPSGSGLRSSTSLVLLTRQLRRGRCAVPSVSTTTVEFGSSARRRPQSRIIRSASRSVTRMQWPAPASGAARPEPGRTTLSSSAVSSSAGQLAKSLRHAVPPSVGALALHRQSIR